MRKFKRILLFGVLGIFLSGAALASNHEQPVATGDGFVITAAEVEEVCKPYMDNRAKITGEQCLNLTLRRRLFAAEAERLRLAPDAKSGKPERMSAARMKELSDLYSRKIVEDFPVKDVVIETYYWAHPDQFREKDDSKKAVDLKPLNDETRKTIKQIVLSTKGLSIKKEAFMRLMESYHVKITGGKKGAAGGENS